MRTDLGTLNRLMEALERMSGLTGEPGYAIAKTKRMIRQDVEVFRELRDGLVRKYGSEENGQISVKPDSPGWAEFLSQYKELYARPVDADLYRVSRFDLDEVRCDKASAEDYDIFEHFMVRRVRDDKPVPDGVDQEDAG